MEEKKNVFVYIRGVEGRGEEVIGTLLKLGGINYLGLDGTRSNWLYHINSFGVIEYTKDDCSYKSTWLKRCYTEIFLPKEEKLKHKFKPFEKVLVRNSGISQWQADLYSHYDDDGGSYRLFHICVGGAYDECLPFEGNEYLLGTIDNPKER